MSGQVLCARLYGHLAAWGSSEAGNAVRPSARHPGRGAVIGFIAAALGIVRDDVEALAHLRDGLFVAVAAHGPRRVEEEFRTTQTIEQSRKSRFINRAEALASGKVHTSITRRQHIEDGLWRIFVSLKPGADLSLDRLAEALRRPRFELYLGRREFPLAMPVDPVVIDGDLDAALSAYPAVPASIGAMRESSPLGDFHAALGRRVVNGQPWELSWDVGMPGAPEGGQTKTVIDDPFSRAAWRFRPRLEASMRMGRYEAPASEKVSIVNEFFPTEDAA